MTAEKTYWWGKVFGDSRWHIMRSGDIGISECGRDMKSWQMFVQGIEGKENLCPQCLRRLPKEERP